MSHHGREGERDFDEVDYTNACRESANARAAIRNFLEGSLSSEGLRNFAIGAGIIPDPHEVALRAQARKQELKRQIADAQAELAKLG